jgi:NAD(P)-dependent dehydrogenase (short-subunit alcohol dehydrogenase family)
MAEQPVALVTGAARPIGRAVALELAGEGFRIAAVCQPGDEAALAEEIGQRGGEYLCLAADMTDPAAHENVLTGVLDAFGRVDLLVGDAGDEPPPMGDVLDHEAVDFDRALAVNLRGPYLFSRRVAVRMVADMHRLAGYRPVMVIITSIAADISATDAAGYCVAMAGLSMAARVLAHRLAAEGVMVYEVRPGFIAGGPSPARRAACDRIVADGGVPQFRWGEPADVARCVKALARGDFAYATGSVLELSGGMQIRRL